MRILLLFVFFLIILGCSNPMNIDNDDVVFIDGDYRFVMKVNATDNECQIRLTLAVAVPDTNYVNVAIYSGTGYLMKTLFSDSLDPGMHEFGWDLCNEDGEPIIDGLYVAELRVGHYLIRKTLCRIS